MKKEHRVQIKQWMPPFLFGVSIIIAYQLIQNIEVLSNWMSALLRVLSPFFVGVVLAYLLDIPCTSLENLLNKSKNKFLNKVSRGLSVAVVCLSTILIIIFLVRKFLPAAYLSFSDFILNSSVYYQNTIHFINQFIETYDIPLDIDFNNIISVSKIRSWLMAIDLSVMFPKYMQSIVSLSSGLFRFCLAIVSAVYFLLSKHEIKKFIVRFLRAFMPGKPRIVLKKYLVDMNHYFIRFLYCQFIDALILGTIATIGLSIIGSRYALLLGSMLAVLNFIPYFGSIFGSILSILIIAITEGIGPAAISSIFLLIIQQTDGNFIQPKLLGSSFKINPALIIISITVAGAYFGVFGMFIIVPIVAVFKNILFDIIAYREKQKADRNELDDDDHQEEDNTTSHKDESNIQED